MSDVIFSPTSWAHMTALLANPDVIKTYDYAAYIDPVELFVPVLAEINGIRWIYRLAKGTPEYEDFVAQYRSMCVPM